MAGLGETCTHISAVLFYLEALHRLKGTETCTQQRCEWIMPKKQTNMDYFCVCTFSQDGQNNLYIERINKDQEFWDTCVQRAEHFIRTSILPELLAKWYTRSNKIYAIAFDTPGSSKEGSSNCMEKLDLLLQPTRKW